MKKTTQFILLLFTVLIIAASCNNQKKNQFTLELTLTGTPDVQVTLQQFVDGDWVKYDSTMTENGKAQFRGTADSPQMFFIAYKNSRALTQVFVEPGTINVKVDFADPGNPIVTGSESQKVFDEYNKSMREIDDMLHEIIVRYQQAQGSNDTVLLEQITDEYYNLEDSKSSLIRDFCVEHNKSVVSPYIMIRNSYMFELEDLEVVGEVLDPSIQSSEYAQELYEKIDILKRVAIGQPYVDFTLDDPQGNPVALSSVIGKNYVLVDFWASWCVPCRKENPNIVATYGEYHDKGFDVFGVSLDRDHGKWVEAIQQDNLTWHHVSDLKYWNSAAGKLYGVQSIPHSVLIDPAGIIIAKNLRGDELKNKLDEMLD